MAAANADDFGKSITDWIHFRNSHSLGPVIIQSFMVLCSLLIVLGLVYVFFLVIAIAVHHFLFDRDPKKVPNYVKHSVQFSSESENSETEKEKAESSSDDEEDEDERSRQAYAKSLRKIAKLDKFLSQGQDVESRLRNVDKK